jgi:hypothetical protein
MFINDDLPERWNLVKKFWVLLTLCVLVLGILPTAAQATSVEDLTALARFFPADTVMFGAVRSDDAYIDDLNTLLERIERRTNSPIVSIQDTLNQSLAYNGLTFEDNIRPWLGDTMAIGVRALNTSNTTNLLLVFDVTDNEPLAALLDDVAADSSTGEEYTQYEFETAMMRLYGNALLVSSTEDMLDDFAYGDRLSDSDDFSDSIGLLPEDDYDIAAYVQTVLLIEAVYEDAQVFATDAPDIVNQVGASGSMAIGFTVLQELGYAIDIAVLPPAEEASPDFVADTDAPALDFGLAENVPAAAALYIQDTHFGDDVRRAIDALSFVMETGIQNDVTLRSSPTEQASEFIQSITAGDIRAFINLGFAGFTGLNLDDDVLANMNGNIAMYLGYIEDDELGLLPDGAFIADMDADAAQNIFDHAHDALTQFDADFTVDDNIITMPQPIRLALESEIDAETLAHPAFDLLFGYSDNLFAIGTRSAVQFSLDPGDATLAGTPNFTAAQDYFLPDAETLFYVNLVPLVPIIDDELMPEASQYGNDALKVLSLFDSASITSRINDDGSGITRAVLVLRSEQ